MIMTPIVLDFSYSKRNWMRLQTLNLTLTLFLTPLLKLSLILHLSLKINMDIVGF